MIGKNELEKLTKEYGDYQTPSDFVIKICKYLYEDLNLRPNVIIEPTFGLGSFIMGSIEQFSVNLTQIFGIEINNNYFDYTKKLATQVIDTAQIELFQLYNENVFTFDFGLIKDQITKNDNMLIIGNPPWVTNSDLTSIGSENLPLKNNFKGLKGLDAITGKGNFDIAEYIILQLLSEFKNYNCSIAMLCKNIVARNIVRDLKKYDFDLSDIRMLTFNAADVFNVNCEACLLVMKLGNKGKLICDVYDFDDPKKKIRSFGWVDNNFISDINKYLLGKIIDGTSPLEWRQGVKHDCSKIMELSRYGNNFINGNKESLSIEDDLVYPLLKSSNLKKYIINDTKKYVIMTQQRVNVSTDYIESKYPELWNYLTTNAKFLDGRKSSIYKNSPKFSIFGVGPYSFKPYKVAISGFYKEPIFSLVYADKPIMLDDTCYFLGFDDYIYALITTIILNHSTVQNFVKSIAFLDSKRPYTKEILMRIDLVKATNEIDFCELMNSANSMGLEIKLCEADYKNYMEYISEIQK